MQRGPNRRLLRQSGAAPRPGARRMRPAERPVGLYIALSVGAGALLIVGLLLLLGGGGGGAKPSGNATPAAGSAHGESSGIAVPTSYTDASVGRLAGQLRARDLRPRLDAAKALAGLGPRAREAVPTLLDAMARPSNEIEFAMALGKAMKAVGPAAVLPIIGILKSGTTKARFVAASALGKLGPDAAGAVQALVQALENDPDTSVRATAASALGAIGAAASSALPTLREAAGNPNETLTHNPQRAELRVRAQVAMDQIKGKMGQ